jgi:hypothetical protein
MIPLVSGACSSGMYCQQDRGDVENTDAFSYRSTFFGGHHKDFATPKDQFVWFKDFSLYINDP